MNGGAGFHDDLGARLRALAAAGGIDPQREVGQSSPATPPTRASRSATPLPPLARRATQSGTARELSAAGLAVADRILAAAGFVTATVLPIHHRQRASPAGDDVRDAAPSATVRPAQATITSPAGVPYRIGEGEALLIGRGVSAGGYAVNLMEVSRRHVHIEMRHGQVLATDLGSANGTSVVNDSVRNLTPNAPTPLNVGDDLMVGTDVLLATLTSLDGPS